jgi:hypothetical protein
VAIAGHYFESRCTVRTPSGLRRGPLWKPSAHSRCAGRPRREAFEVTWPTHWQRAPVFIRRQVAQKLPSLSELLVSPVVSRRVGSSRKTTISLKELSARVKGGF